MMQDLKNQDCYYYFVRQISVRSLSVSKRCLHSFLKMNLKLREANYGIFSVHAHHIRNDFLRVMSNPFSERCVSYTVTVSTPFTPAPTSRVALQVLLGTTLIQFTPAMLAAQAAASANSPGTDVITEN